MTPTLGELLRSKRIEQGRSLEQVAASTKIHAKILGALESDQYSELPARTFTRGFIVNYAKALKLDPDQILKDYQEFLEEKFNDRPNRDQGHQGYAFEGKEIEQNKRWLVIGASLAALFAISVLLIFKPQNHKHQEKHKEFEEEASADATPSDDLENTSPLALKTNTNTNVGTSILISTNSSSSLVNTSHLAIVSSSVSATPAASVSVIPAVVASATKAASPSPTATPSGSPSESPTPKPDKLNKGDNLEPKEVKRKITLQAKGDVWVRYQSDDRPVGIIILRKDRVLVVKAKSRLVIEVNHPELVNYKTKSSQYQDLTLGRGEVGDDQSLKEDAGKVLGPNPLPVEVPSPSQPQ